MDEQLRLIATLDNKTRRVFADIRGDTISIVQVARRANRSIGDFAPSLRGAARQAGRLEGELGDINKLAGRIEDAFDRQTKALQRQGRAARQLARAQARAASEARRAAQAQQSVGGVGSGLVGGLVAGAGIAGALQLGRATAELAQTGAEAQRLRTSFENLATQSGTTGDALLSSLRAASRGAINDTELILSANRANLLGVAQTAQELDQLLRVARARGQALGLSTQQAFEDIVTGIGRESRLILDNLGIIVDIEAAQKTYAASLGITADALDAVQRKRAITNQIVAQSTQLLAADAQAAGDSAAAFERLAAARANLSATVGGGLANIFAGPANFGADLIDTANRSLLILGGNAEASRDRVRALRDEFNTLNDIASNPRITSGIGIAPESAAVLRDLARSALETAAANQNMVVSFDDAGNAVVRLDAEASRTAGTLESYRAIVSATGGDLQSFGDLSGNAGRRAEALSVTMSGAGSGFIGFAQDVLQAVQALNELAATNRAITSSIDTGREAIFRQAAGVADIVGQERALQLANQQSQIFEDQVDSTRSIADNTELVAFQTELARQNASGVFAEITKADAAARKLATGGAKAVNREFSQLRSRVQGVLAGALNLDVGVNLDQILGRQDAINEPARRLADLAVKGFDSPWVDYFRNNFPDLLSDAFEGGADIKKSAARALRDFEAGLRPELLDKERAKERVRRLLVGEANIAALADEISRELARELGKSTGDVRAAANQALGIGTGEAQRVRVQPDLTGFQEQLNQTFNLALGAGTAQAEGVSAGGALKAGLISSIGGVGLEVAELMRKEFTAKATLDLVGLSGEANGKSFLAGFERGIAEISNVFLDKVADLVTSRVSDRLTNRQTLVGAN